MFRGMPGRGTSARTVIGGPVDNERIVFLVIGVVIVAVVGRLLVLSGRRYLTNSAPAEGESAGSAATLLAVLFHLLTLGIVALLAVVPVGSSGQQGLLIRVGVLLVVLALIYGAVLALLSRRRQEAIIAEIESERVRGNEVHTGIRVEPVDPADVGEAWRHPMNPNAGTATGQPRPDRSL